MLPSCAGTEAPHDDSPGLLSLQSVEPAEEGAPEACKEEEVAGAIAAFTSGYSPGQRAIVGAGGLPKLTQLLTSDSPAVQDKALSALLVSLVNHFSDETSPQPQILNSHTLKDKLLH